MSKERELLERWLDDTIFEPEELDSLMEETRELLAQPKQEPVNFDLERMKLAVESPVSDVTVEGLIDKVKSNRVFYQEGYAQAELDLKREHIVDVTDKVEPVAWMCNLLGNVITDKPADNNSYTPLYKSPPKRKTLSRKESEALWEALFKSAISYLVFDEICVAINQTRYRGR